MFHKPHTNLQTELLTTTLKTRLLQSNIVHENDHLHKLALNFKENNESENNDEITF